MKPTTIIIGGNFRGGTSATAGLFQTAGVFMGCDMGFNKEDKEFQAIFHGNPQPDRAILTKLIDRRNRQHQIWGFKYPAIHQSINQVQYLFRNPKVFFVLRDPEAVADSECRRTGQRKDMILRRTLNYNNNMVAWASEMPHRVKLISFERLLTRTRETVEEIFRFAEIAPGCTILELCETINLQSDYHRAERQTLNRR